MPKDVSLPRDNPASERLLGALSPSAVVVLAAGLLALSYPPFPLGFLAPVALALGLFGAGLGRAHPPASLRTVAWRGFVFGSVFHLATMYWIWWVSIPGLFTVVIVLGLYVAAVFAACAYLEQRFGPSAVWLFPAIWIAHEYLRTLGALAFPWTNLSLSQVKYPNLIQYADITGDLGVSFAVALIAVLLLRISRRLAAGRGHAVRFHVTAIILAYVLPYLYGQGAVRALTSTESVRVAVLQGDIDSFHKWDEGFLDRSLAVYEMQTRVAAAQGAELIVWPETAVPMYLRSEPHYRRMLAQLSAEVQTHLLIGTLEYTRLDDGRYLRYNAAVGLADGIYGEDYHAKLHLVPLGEWIPFSDHFRFLDQLDVGGAHFTAGDRIVLFDHAKGPYGAAICYESAFPEIMRRFVLGGARFLVNITNDGWYGFSSGPAQHAAFATFRAIETRRPIARSANTGISGFVDRTGRWREASHQYVPEIKIWDLPLGPPDATTVFLRHGMFFGQTCLGLTLMTLLMAGGMHIYARRAGANGVDAAAGRSEENHKSGSS